MPRASATRTLLETLEALVLGPLTYVSWPIARAWLRDHRATPEERTGPWPGDRLCAPGAFTTTRAIDVAAPVGAVWPWLLQLGYDRGGYHSYAGLERLLGIPVRNAESIEPAWQRIERGHRMPLHPRLPALVLEDLAPDGDERHLCYRLEGPPDAPARTWSLYLRARTPQTSRLLVRAGIDAPPRPSWRHRLVLALETPGHFVMEQRMLRTIRRLAEASPRSLR